MSSGSTYAAEYRLTASENNSITPKGTVKALVSFDKRILSKLRMAKEGINRAKELVRWKGSVKAGEAVLRDSILLAKKILSP